MVTPLWKNTLSPYRVFDDKKLGAFRAPLRTSHKKGKPSSTAILKALLQEQPIGILAKPLEGLFECISLAILEQVALEEAQQA